MEFYATSQEICVWGSSTLQGYPAFDAVSQRWTARVTRTSEQVQELHPAHLVMATGATGKPNTPAVPGIDRFRGRLYHSSQHHGAKEYAHKRVVVIGAVSVMCAPGMRDRL